jgi:hypothetical protein
MDWADNMHCGLRKEIVKGMNSRNHGRKSCGHLWWSHVGNVRLAIHIQFVNLGMKRLAYLPGGSAEYN